MSDVDIENIENMEERFMALEQALACAAAREFQCIDVQHTDALAALELGVNIVVEDLRGELELRETVNRELDLRVAERTLELQQKLDQITTQNELIQRQRDAIDELSTPVLQLWNQVIAMPIIGVVDTRRGAELSDKLLAASRAGQVRFALLDITGVEVVDTSTADHLAKVVRAAQLLGTRCILTGVQPAVAQTLVAIGVDFSAITTRRNLQDGLRACFEAMSEAKSLGDVQ